MYLTPAARVIASIALWPLELTPAEPTLIWPGFARIASISSPAVLYGDDTGTESVTVTVTLPAGAAVDNSCQGQTGDLDITFVASQLP